MRRLALLFLGSCMTATAAVPVASPSLSAAVAEAVAVPPLAFRDRTLANGLRVVSVQDHSSPTVSVQVWYGVGGKDDPAGRSGFAHLFEHLMFKSTKHLANEQFDRLTEDVGGTNNASTHEDVTNYYAVVPSNHLERLLWAEAERMSNLDVNDANFQSERAVVQEEYRQHVLADPYGRFFESFAPRSYTTHPYRHGVIGDIAQLDAATLADVRAFHATYYRPDNALVIVAGDFDPSELDRWVDRYFGAIARPQTPIPRVDVREPARTRDTTFRETGPNVPLPAVALTWLGPSARSPDAAALHVAAALLAEGDSSRLYRSLVYRQEIAQYVGFSIDPTTDAGLVVAYAIGANGATPATLAAALDAEIAKLASRPIPAAELAKVKLQLVTQELEERETPIGKGMAIGEAVVYHGDPAFANRDLGELQAVSAADVQRVLRRYVIDAKRVTIEYTQEKQRKATPRSLRQAKATPHPAADGPPRAAGSKP